MKIENFIFFVHKTEKKRKEKNCEKIFVDRRKELNDVMCESNGDLMTFFFAENCSESDENLLRYFPIPNDPIIFFLS